MPRDPQKALARKRRYLERKKIEKFGPDAAGRDMRGRHGNHARGRHNGRWNDGRLITSQGYIAVRVSRDHPHAWGPPGTLHAYAYEHILVVMERIGRPLQPDETVHHRNGDRADNRDENLELLTRSEHAREHAIDDARDDLGRFAPDARRVREWPSP